MHALQVTNGQRKAFDNEQTNTVKLATNDQQKKCDTIQRRKQMAFFI